MARSLLDSYYAAYWNNKWKKTTIIYNARSAGYIPIQDILNDGFDKKIYIDTDDNDEKVKQVLLWARDKLKYKGDREVWNKPEYWQTASETWDLMSGDCEDGAIIMYKLLRNMGVPAFRLKICAGDVLNPMNPQNTVGHAYLIYLSERHNTWHVVDWCYWPGTSYMCLYGVPHSKITNYRRIWWSFNEDHMWSQHDTEVLD